MPASELLPRELVYWLVIKEKLARANILVVYTVIFCFNTYCLYIQ